MNPYRIFLLSKTSKITIWRGNAAYDAKAPTEAAETSEREGEGKGQEKGEGKGSRSVGNSVHVQQISSSSGGNTSGYDAGRVPILLREANAEKESETIELNTNSVELTSITKEEINIEFDSYSDKNLIEYIKKVDSLLPSHKSTDEKINYGTVELKRSGGSFSDLLKSAFGGKA